MADEFADKQIPSMHSTQTAAEGLRTFRTAEGFANMIYPKEHPSPSPAIKQVEETLTKLAIYGSMPGQLRDAEGEKDFGIPKGNNGYVTIYVEGHDPVVTHFPTPSLSSPLPTYAEVYQGDKFNSANRYFFCDARLYTRANALSMFYNHWGEPISAFMKDPKVRDYLLSSIDPAASTPSVLSFDLRTKLLDGKRGLIRGGFAQELLYRYFDAVGKIKGVDKPINTILGVLNGDGSMDDIYNQYQEAKAEAREELHDASDDTVNEEAIRMVRPYNKWGFASYKVVELPKEIGKLIVYTASRTD